MIVENEFIYDLHILDLDLNVVERDNVKFSNPVSVGDIINEHNCKYVVTIIEHFINHGSTVINCHVYKPTFKT